MRIFPRHGDVAHFAGVPSVGIEKLSSQSVTVNNGTFLWNFFPNSVLQKFRRGISVVVINSVRPTTVASLSD